MLRSPWFDDVVVHGYHGCPSDSTYNLVQDLVYQRGGMLNSAVVHIGSWQDFRWQLLWRISYNWKGSRWLSDICCEDIEDSWGSVLKGYALEKGTKIIENPWLNTKHCQKICEFGGPKTLTHRINQMARSAPLMGLELDVDGILIGKWSMCYLMIMDVVFSMFSPMISSFSFACSPCILDMLNIVEPCFSHVPLIFLPFP